MLNSDQVKNLRHITNIRDPRIDSDGNLIEGRDLLELPNIIPDEWLYLTDIEKRLKNSDGKPYYSSEYESLYFKYISGCKIGVPKKTDLLSSDELLAKGMIGLYRDII